MRIRIPLCRCPECGEPLFDGDTAYRLGERLYCCACVRRGLTVCRKPVLSGESYWGRRGDGDAGKK